MLLRMRRVDVVAPRRLASQTLRAVHRAGLLHLVPYEAPAGLGPAVFSVEPDASSGTPFDPAIERVAELVELLGSGRPATEAIAGLWEVDDRELLARAAALEPIRRRAADAAADRIRLTGDLSRIDGYRRIIEGLQGVVGRLPAVRGYASTGIVVAARYRSIVPLVREELEALTDGRCEVVAADLGPDRVAAILLYPMRLAADVRSLLGGRELEEVSLPEELAGVPFDELEPRLARERERLLARRAEAEAELGRLAAGYAPTVAALRLVLADRLAEQRALRDAAMSDHLTVLCGWLPTRDVAALRDVLAREVGTDVIVVERADAGRPPADAPVAFEHGRVVRAFAPLASFVAIPRYGTIDPTPLVALTFPAFVGLMVGDVGYGAIALALLALARRRWRHVEAMRVLWPIGLLATISTIVFGILFGELFGGLGRAWLGIGPLWLDRDVVLRADAAVELLALAVSIGVAQVGLGLALGVANAALLGHGREIASRGALLVCLVAILILLGATARALPGELVPIAGATLLVALVVLVVSAGLAGPIEVVGVLGNVLSYARLMAIGLASVMLAIVANRLGGLVPNVILGVLVAGLLHALNLTLGFFDASIQGLRLHYVEFFGQFLESGGVRYEPFVSALGSGIHPPASPSPGGP